MPDRENPFYGQPAGQFSDRHRPGYPVADGIRNSAGSGPQRRPGNRTRSGADPRGEAPPAGSQKESLKGISGGTAENTYVEASPASAGESSEGNSEESSEVRSEARSEDCPWCCGRPVPQSICPEHELLHGIALEEVAIAHLINAEAEKAQAVAKHRHPPLSPEELIEYQRSIAKVLEMAVEQEKLLLRKLRLLLYKPHR